MDELTVLRNLYRDTPGPSAEETSAARARLAAAMAGPAPVRPPGDRAAFPPARPARPGGRRRLSRPRFWAPAAAAAGVTAIAVTAALIGVPGHRGQSLSGPASPALLLREAATAARQAPPPGHGRYFATVSEFAYPRPPGDMQYNWLGPGASHRDTLQIGTSRTSTGTGLGIGRRDLSLMQVQQLPTSPGPLLAYLAQAWARHPGPLAADEFQSVTELLTQAPVSPALRAALFEVAARLPGLTLVPHARDLIGRPATEVYLQIPSRIGLSYELLFDPSTGAVLGFAYGTALPPRCQPIYEAALVSAGYVKSVPYLPAGSMTRPRPVLWPASRCRG